MQLSPYVFLHLLSAAFLGGLGVYCWLYRTVPVTTSIAQVMFLCAGLALDYAFDLSSFSLPDKLFWMKGRFFFLAVVPVLWLVLIVRYTGQEALVTRRRLATLFVVPAITVILAWTSDHHTLFRYNYHLDNSGLFPILLWNSGPWYWVHICYSYGLFAASLILLILSLRDAQSFYRRQSLMIIGGASLPVIADAVFHTGIPPLPGYIISTTILFLAGFMIVWALFHYAMLNVVPIARSVVLEKMSDIMIVLDGCNRVVDFNAAAQKVFRLQSAQGIGKPMEELLSRWPDLLLRCRKLECANEAVHIGKGTSRRSYDLSVTPIHDRRDEATGRVIIMRDITDRQTAEEALRKSEKYFKEITENSSDIVIITDKNGDIKYCSPSIERFAGYKPEELIGRSAFAFIHPDDVERAVDDYARAILAPDSAIPNGFRIIHKDGSERYFDGLGKNLLDNPSVAGFIMNIRDITEHKRAEAALRVSEEKYRLLADNISDVIWVLDLNMRPTYCSPSVKQLLGYTQEEYLSKGIEEIVAPSSYPSVAEAMAEELEIDKKEPKDLLRSRVMEMELIRKEGSKVWAGVRAKFLRDANGQAIAILGVSRDISESKRAEEERHLMEERLRRAEKMEALGTLAGGVAHDLNNILSGIVSYPDLILMELPEESPLREAIVTIRQSGQRAAAVVQDLLTLARRGVVSTEVLNLNEVISDYLKTPEQEQIRVYQPKVRFDTQLEQGLLPIKGSRVHLSKTVMNLLLNAAEAMPGGGTVTITTMVQYLDRPVKGYDEVREGDYAVLMVADTGTGISAQDRGRIFEPFYTKKVMGRTGTGLGLAVVWGTVKDHNGYIDVQSEEGNGTTFSLYFPVAREALTGNQPPVLREDYQGKGETILVVDDVKELRDLAVAMLTKLNYQAASVSGGEEAVQYMKTRQADLLVLDMIMDPGIDGLETYRRILEFCPGQKAIIVSGFSETERVRQAQGLGSGTYVRKPYAMERIGLAVRQELDR